MQRRLPRSRLVGMRVPLYGMAASIHRPKNRIGRIASMLPHAPFSAPNGIPCPSRIQERLSRVGRLPWYGRARSSLPIFDNPGPE